MAQHGSYWCNSKFGNWLRGNHKPNAATMDAWDDWKTEAEAAHPIRYWLAEEGLQYVQDFVTWPVRTLHAAKYYINNRWVTRTHSLTAHARDIKPGHWCDVGNRFLPCLFNELVDFVEIELAWHHIVWQDKEETAKYQAPFWAKGWWRVRTWRCAEAGLDSLEWQSRLTNGNDGFGPANDDETPTPQAVKAQEIMDLYNWWTRVRPARPDPYDASGYSALTEQVRAENGGKFAWGRAKPPGLAKAMQQAHKLLTKLEAANEKEDEQMMIRLIRVRHGLWT